jgi:parallel beta-helix repeat protein
LAGICYPSGVNRKSFIIMKVKIFSILISGLLLFSCSPGNDTTLILHSSDYISMDDKDATFGMVHLIKDARESGNARVIIEKGIYHFYPDKAFEKYCHITNHDDGLRSTPFPLIDCKNIEIISEGAEFIFHGAMVPFLIEGSENVSLEGFTIDWELPLHSEVEVIAHNEGNHTFDIKVECPYEIRNRELIFLKEGYEHNLNRSICWDPGTKAVLYNTQHYTTLLPYANKSLVRYTDPDPIPNVTDMSILTNRERGYELSLFAKEIEPGIVRLSGHKRALPPVGCIIVAKGENLSNRWAPAIRCINSRNLMVKDVTIHHAGGMGIICERTKNVKLANVKVSLRDGSGRLLTTSADATHFNNCKGKIIMQDCLFENMLDDATNVHGTFVRVTDILDPFTLGVRLGHFQQLGYIFAEENDKIGFIKEAESAIPYHFSQVNNVERINKRYYIISFQDELPSNVSEGDLLDNLDWYPEVEIRDCIVRNNRARGFLLGTDKNIIVEGNTISTMMSAIIIHASTEGGFWYESGVVRNCRIANNTFGDCNYGGGKSAVIRAHPGASNDKFPLGKIVIENNYFNTFDPLVLEGSGIDSLVFRNNVVSASGNYPHLFGDSPVLDVENINYSEISENQLEEGYILN